MEASWLATRADGYLEFFLRGGERITDMDDIAYKDKNWASLGHRNAKRQVSRRLE
jgi:hypothetical protein